MASANFQLAGFLLGHKLDHDLGVRGHFMTISYHGGENAHFQVWQRFCWLAIQCAVTELAHKIVSKILWTTCLTSLLVQENIPSYCFFRYLELHCYHHWSHMQLCIISSETQSHIWHGCCCLVAQSCLTLCNPMTVACQAPLSIGLSRQEYWSRLPFPSPRFAPSVKGKMWKCSRSVVSDFWWIHGIFQARLLE